MRRVEEKVNQGPIATERQQKSNAKLLQSLECVKSMHSFDAVAWMNAVMTSINCV